LVQSQLQHFKQVKKTKLALFQHQI